MRAIRLSGWARLWIVLIAPFWAGGVWSGLNNAVVDWRSGCSEHICMTNGALPKSRLQQPTECRHLYACRLLGYDRRARPAKPWEDNLTIDVPAGESRSEFLEQTRDQNDQSAYALLERYRSQLWEGVWVPTVIALLTFFLAMLAKSAALWVWRGFRPAKAPVRDGDG